MNTDSTLLVALQKKDEKALRYVYWKFYESVRKFVLTNSGTEEDAEDIFQEALLVLLSNICRADFVLSSSIKTYHFAICRHLWLSQLEKNRRKNQERISVELEEYVSEEDPDSEENWDSLQVVLDQITQYCFKLLSEIYLVNQISKSFKNAHAMHNQKYKCLVQARKAARKIKMTAG